MIAAWCDQGYTVKLVFLSFATLDEAIARVAMRVRRDGHDVPAATIRRRFTAGLRNFTEAYPRRADYWQWFDNSGDTPILVEEGRNP